MGITGLLDAPFYTGSPVSENAAGGTGQYDVALNGRGFMLDLKSNQYQHQSIQLLRAQTDQADEPGAQSINPEDFWRRSQHTWHHGAGQTFLDRKTSDSFRFRSSKGIDVWTENRFGLLPAAGSVLPTVETNLFMVPAGDRLYVCDGGNLKFTTDVTAVTPSFTTVTATPADDPTGIASNGFDVWTVHGPSGVYATDTNSTVTAAYVTDPVNGVIGYVKGRLMVTDDENLYNVTIAGPLPTPLFTPANSDFRWVGFAQGKGFIYAAGFSGDKSLVYKVTVLADATGLDAPIVAGELPDGELVYSIGGYLGFVWLGTSKGVRFCIPDNTGDLTIGDVIPTALPPKCFEGQDKFMWFGWANYDSTSTGLGRMSLRDFGDEAGQVLAYASDLMATTQGDVQSVVSFQELRVFSVSGDGYWRETSDLVADGTLDAGVVTYNIFDQKLGIFLDVRYGPNFGGSDTAWIAVDSSTSFTQLGAHSDSAADNTHELFNIPQFRSEAFEVRHTLARAADPTNGPTVTSHTLLVEPAASLREIRQLPLLLGEHLDVDGAEVYTDPSAALAEIKALHASRQLVTLQEGADSATVIVRDYEWHPTSRTQNRSAWNGVLLTYCKTV